jgi:hypothetical protein
VGRHLRIRPRKRSMRMSRKLMIRNSKTRKSRKRVKKVEEEMKEYEGNEKIKG